MRVAASIAAATLLAWGPVDASQLAQIPSHYPPCTTAMLAGFPWTHRAFGHAIPGIALRNVTLATCRVAGFPIVRIYETNGRRAAVTIERKEFVDDRIYAYSVKPGSAVFFALYGQAPTSALDRSCIGIGQIDVTLAPTQEPTDVTVASGTCGGRMTESQLFPVEELAL